MKFNFFPDIFSDYVKDFTSDTVWHRFPNGRRRREILTDPITNQTYERYDGYVQQIGDFPLSNETAQWRGDNEGTMENEDDEFDDQFEEDLQDKKLMEEFFLQQHQQVDNEVDKSDEQDLSLSRWVAYDALGSMLQR